MGALPSFLLARLVLGELGTEVLLVGAGLVYKGHQELSKKQNKTHPIVGRRLTRRKGFQHCLINTLHMDLVKLVAIKIVYQPQASHTSLPLKALDSLAA